MRKIETTDVLKLIPQRSPFVMIDRLLSHDAASTSCGLRIKPDNIFVEDGRFTEAGIIESIAQTCAARMGYINCVLQEEATGKPAGVKIGFIGSIKNMLIDHCPQVNDEITIRAKILNEIFAVMLIQAVVTKGNERVASGEMKIFLTNIDDNSL